LRSAQSLSVWAQPNLGQAEAATGYRRTRPHSCDPDGLGCGFSSAGLGPRGISRRIRLARAAGGPSWIGRSCLERNDLLTAPRLIASREHRRFERRGAQRQGGLNRGARRNPLPHCAASGHVPSSGPNWPGVRTWLFDRLNLRAGPSMRPDELKCWGGACRKTAFAIE